MPEGHIAEGRIPVTPGPAIVAEGVTGGVVLEDGALATTTAVVALIGRRAPPLLPGEEEPILRILRGAVRPRAAPPNMEVAPFRVGLGGTHVAPRVTGSPAATAVEVAAMAVHVTDPARDVVGLTVRARLAEEGSAVLPFAGRRPVAARRPIGPGGPVMEETAAA